MSMRRRKNKPNIHLENFLSKVIQDKREIFEYDSLRTVSHKNKNLVKIAKQNSEKSSSYFSSVITSGKDSFKYNCQQSIEILNVNNSIKNLETNTTFYSTVNASRNDTLNYNSLRESENEKNVLFQNDKKNLVKSSSYFSTVNASRNENLREK